MTTETFTDNVEVLGSRDVEQLTIQGHSSQTAPLQTWANSAGDVLGQVAADGRLQVGDLSIDAPDALIEANNDLILPTSEAIQGVQSRGLIRGAISNALAWVVQELELLGTSVTGLHTAVRAKLLLDSAGDVTQAQGRAADFEAINRSGVSGTPAGTMTGVQSTVTNQATGHLDEAVGVGISVQDEGTNQIQTAYGVKIEDMPSTSQDSYAIHTGGGSVFIGDQMGINVASPGAQLEVESADANRAATVAKAASDQTANVRETQDNTGAVLEGIDNVGATVQKEQSSVPGTPAAGYRKLYPKADGWYDQDSTGVETKVGSGSGGAGIPSGSLVMWSVDTAPSGWLLCDGQAVDRATYAELFSTIGTTFGAGNGTTTFNIPDMRGRFPLGADNIGGTSANRVTDAQADAIGGSGGTETHTLTITEVPAHTHDVVGTYSSTGANRFIGSGGTGYAHATITTTSTGGNGAHNNMSPYLTVHYIIKA